MRGGGVAAGGDRLQLTSKRFFLIDKKLKKCVPSSTPMQFTPPGSLSLTHLPSMGRPWLLGDVFSPLPPGTAAKGDPRLLKNRM